MGWYFYFSGFMFLVGMCAYVAHTKDLERVEKVKKSFTAEVGHTRTVPYKDAVVTIYPDGNFIVNGRDNAHCKQIHDEVIESFKRRYL
tara:strand:- start:2479 stop:2742 length:264 start_codon:yes stop_codon:yes gene_type:complete